MSDVRLSEEVQFVLSCASKRADQNFNGLNWDTVLRIARNHGLVAFLYDALSNVPGIPSEVIQSLREQVTRIAAWNGILTTELLATLKLFGANNIRAIPYKGPVLAHALYGNTLMRDFGDLDLLVHKKDVPLAKSLLLANGYRPTNFLKDLTSAQERVFLDSNYSYDFIGSAPNQQLEIHWDVAPKAFAVRLNYEAIWRRTTEIEFEKTRVSVLSAEDLLLLLCISGAKKLWDRALRVMDVAKTPAVYTGIDWDTVISRAIEARAQRILLLGLSLASTLFEAPLPVDVTKRINSDRAIMQLKKHFINRMFFAIAPSGMISPYDQFQPLHMRMRERLGDRIRYFFLITFTPGVGDWAFLKLPAPLHFFYRVVRPVRLFGKALRRLPRLIANTR